MSNFVTVTVHVFSNKCVILESEKNKYLCIIFFLNLSRALVCQNKLAESDICSQFLLFKNPISIEIQKN